MSVGVLVIDPQSPATLYAQTTSGVFKSTNGGGAWADASVGLPSGGFLSSLVIDPAAPATLHAGVNGAGVYESKDAGATWTAVNQGLPTPWVTAVAVGGTVANRILYAGTDGAGVWQLRRSTGAFHTVTPCRAVDTRSADGPALGAGTIRSFTLVGKCGVPAEAGSVSVNVTVTGATSGGHLRLFPGNTALPPASSLNFSAGQTRANNAVCRLGAAGELSIYSGQPAGSVDVIVDVTGYFP